MTHPKAAPGCVLDASEAHPISHAAGSEVHVFEQRPALPSEAVHSDMRLRRRRYGRLRGDLHLEAA